MGHRQRAVRFVEGLAVLVLLLMGETAVGQGPALETVVFVDASKEEPACCPIPSAPVEVVAEAAVRDLPGILRISVDPDTGRLTISFDPARVSRAKIMAALAWYNFTPLEERR